MCKCTPSIRTPYCGRGDCKAPVSGTSNQGYVHVVESDSCAKHKCTLLKVCPECLPSIYGLLHSGTPAAPPRTEPPSYSLMEVLESELVRGKVSFGYSRNVHVVAQTKTEFSIALAMALGATDVTHYYAVPDRLIFYWHADSSAVPFPFKMSRDLCINFAWEWLSHCKYGNEPDTDGSAVVGFEIETAIPETSGGHYGICSIKPEWIVYGK